MGLVFYTMEWLLLVLTFVGKHWFASCDLQNLLNELNRPQQNLLRLEQECNQTLKGFFTLSFCISIFVSLLITGSNLKLFGAISG